MLTFIARKRLTDKFGQGSYGAPRGDRTHVGIDYAAWPGSTLLSPVEGKVTKIGYPYGDDLSFRYVQVEDAEGLEHRFFYVNPMVHTGQEVVLGDKLGTVQPMDHRYKGITPHVHYEVKFNGEYVDPEEVWA